jgi:hypothetical protein
MLSVMQCFLYIAHVFPCFAAWATYEDNSRISMRLSKIDTYYMCHHPDPIGLDFASVTIGDPSMIQAFGLNGTDDFNSRNGMYICIRRTLL